MSTPVFRETAILAKANSAVSRVEDLAVVRVAKLSILLVGFCLVVIAFLALTPFPVSVRVVGYLTFYPQETILFSPQNGTVKQVLVQAGQEVEKGDPMVVIRPDQPFAKDPERITAQIALKKQRIEFLQSAAVIRGKSVTTRIAALEQAVMRQETVVSVSLQHLDIAQEDLKRAEALVEKGVVSDSRKAEVRKQMLKDEIEHHEKSADLEQLREQLSNLRDEALRIGEDTRLQINALKSDEEELQLDLSEAKAANEQVIFADVAGEVDYLQARPGGRIDTLTALCSIVPPSSEARIVLFMDATAVNLIRNREHLRLSIKIPEGAWRFIDTSIVEVSKAPLPAGAISGIEKTVEQDPTTAFYRAVVQLSDENLRGLSSRLERGQKLQAVILTHDVSLLENVLSRFRGSAS